MARSVRSSSTVRAAPICPTIITGVHIDNTGNCVVDRETGLNCKWFLLQEPMIRKIGNVREVELETLFKKVKEYREKCFAKNGNGVRKCEAITYAFGGCGGEPQKIIQLARREIKNIPQNKKGTGHRKS